MATYTTLGKSTPRLDGPEKVTGELRYTGDLQFPGMLHARLVLSPYAHARIRRIDASAALKVPGVAFVVTGKELPIAKPQSSRKGEPLAREEVVFNGQPVAVVLAETEAAAEDAVPLVQVEYELLPVVMDPRAAIQPGAPPVRLHQVGGSDEESLHATVALDQGEEAGPLPPNTTNRIHFKRGDVARGLREADVVVERQYHTQWAHQSYLEPQSAVGWYDPMGTLTIWTSTQGLFYTRRELALVFGLPIHKIKIVPMPVGGGFGGKVVLVEPLVGALALLVKRPVRLVFTRGEEFYAANPASQAIFEVKLGAKRDGTLTTLQARVLYDTGAFSGSPMGISCILLGAYKFANLDILGYEILTNRVGTAAYRAPGAPQAFFALESTVDEMARALGADPLELRLRNAVAEGDLMPDGRQLPRIGLRECLEKLKDHPAWQRRNQKGPNEGIGLAIGGWPGGLEAASAACRLDADGTFTMVTGSVDLTGTNTTFAMIASELLGIPPEQVRVVNDDSDSAPYSGMSGGSKVTYTVGAAVRRAAEDARRQVLEIAAQELEVAVDDLELVAGTVRVKGVPDRSMTLTQVADATQRKYEPVNGRGGSAITTNAPGYTAHLARVAVDPGTGRTRVVEYVAAHDVGFALNPAAIEGQIIGGIAQGIGWALYEQMVYDDQGTLLTASFMDYAIPKAEDVPAQITPLLVAVPSADGPFGAKGIGEPPVIPGAAAIANAIRDATGHRLTRLPITSEAIVDALRGLSSKPSPSHKARPSSDS
ncbi:MAG TPA: xanthine dehydrogenase family protein molybdopterin-binding subunit [Chloroflexota bacterium]|nr:xanthine dehydrogenase family protein molybdopterin-binding subunit [Chloroflexota bacterium]